MDPTRVLRHRGITHQLRRTTDEQLQTIIENTIVQIESETAFLHQLQAELAHRHLGVPRQSRLNEDTLF